MFTLKASVAGSFPPPVLLDKSADRANRPCSAESNAIGCEFVDLKAWRKTFCSKCGSAAVSRSQISRVFLSLHSACHVERHQSYRPVVILWMFIGLHLRLTCITKCMLPWPVQMLPYLTRTLNANRRDAFKRDRFTAWRPGTPSCYGIIPISNASSKSKITSGCLRCVVHQSVPLCWTIALQQCFNSFQASKVAVVKWWTMVNGLIHGRSLCHVGTCGHFCNWSVACACLPDWIWTHLRQECSRVTGQSWATNKSTEPMEKHGKSKKNQQESCETGR